MRFTSIALGLELVARDGCSLGARRHGSGRKDGRGRVDILGQGRGMT